MPSLVIFLCARTIPKRFRFIRMFTLSGISAVFFAPYIADFDGLPVLKPVYGAFFDYTFPLKEKHLSLVVSGTVLFLITFSWQLFRSRKCLNK